MILRPRWHSTALGALLAAGLMFTGCAPADETPPTGEAPAATASGAAQPKAEQPKAEQTKPAPTPAAPGAPASPAGAAPAEKASSGLMRTSKPNAPLPAVPPTKKAPGALPSAVDKQQLLSEGTAEQLMAIDKANRALAAGDQSQALTHFVEAFQGPTSGAGITGGIGAASMHEQAGRADEARKIYDELLEKVPEVAEIRFTAGRFFGSVGDKSRAIVEFRKVLEIQPDFLPAYPMLGALLTQTEKPDEAAALMLDYERRLKALLDQLLDPEVRWFRRRPIIDIFALVDDERVTRALIKSLGDKKAEIRLAAGDALALDPAPEALKALAKAVMDEEDPIFKRALAASLRRAEALARQDLQKAGPTPSMPPPGGQ